MNIAWTELAWSDYVYWQQNNRKTLRKLNELIKDIVRNGYEGLGKPEPLKHDLSGYWSRRIDSANRIVYKIEDEVVTIVECRSHYENM